MTRASGSVRAAVDQLATGRRIRCKEMIRLLEGLGFLVRDGRKQGHKIVTHPGLDDFLATSFSCGHGKNPQIKPHYVASLRKLLESRLDELSDMERIRK